MLDPEKFDNLKVKTTLAVYHNKGVVLQLMAVQTHYLEDGVRPRYQVVNNYSVIADSVSLKTAIAKFNELKNAYTKLQGN